jgi:hypothetical protein
MPGKPISPDDQRGFNRRLIEAMEKLNLIYAIGGSVAAMVYSESRLTIDIDIMLDVRIDELERFVNEVSSWQIYIAPLEAILETDIPHGLPFNALDGSIGTKADFFVAKDAGLDASAMARRRRLTADNLTGTEAWFLAPEDVILYKLRYYRQSGELSQKHPLDIAKMLAVIGDQLDLAYTEKWAAEIGVLDLWQALWDEFQKK